MGRVGRKPPPKKPIGRPQKLIDWDLVDELLESGCDGSEIAPHFNMHPSTFLDRVLDKYGMTFTEFAACRYKKGDSLIRRKQFTKAMTGDGDNTMLIWLGKMRLGQKETTDINIGAEETEAFKAVLSKFNKIQEERKAISKDLAIDENKS